MKWLLLVTLVLWAVVGWGFWRAMNASHNYGELIYLIVPVPLALVSTLAYIIAAIWTHRLW